MGGTGGDFVSAWKELDGQFDSFNRLKELRTLVAKGAVSQEVYEEVHRYVLDSNLSEKDKKKIDKKQKKARISLPSAKSTKWEDKPVMEGFLYKRSVKSGRNWKRRYFRLYNDRMNYFKKKEDMDPRGTIAITKDLYASDAVLKKIKNARKNGFMISDFQTTYYLAADTPESRVYWLHTISRLISKLQAHEEVDTPVMLGGQLSKSKSVKDQEYRSRVEALRKTASNSRQSALKRPVSNLAPVPKANSKVEEEDKGEEENEEQQEEVKEAEVEAGDEELSALSRVLSDREFRIKSVASAAMSAHMSARESVQSNLGLNVMSYDEQMKLREEAADAEAQKLLVDIQNEAAMSKMDKAVVEEETLKEEVKKAKETGDEEKLEEILPELEKAKEERVKVGEEVVRTAAERAEFDDIVERNEKVIAESMVANEIVLELSQTDPAVLLAEQLAEDAKKARERAEAAATVVREAMLKESKQKEAELKHAEEQAKKAEKIERKRALEEAKVLKLDEKLENEAKKKVNEKQQKKVEEVKKARQAAEQERFEKELRATQLANEKLDAMAKAAAVERTLRETQDMINKDRVNHGYDEFDFAKPKARQVKPKKVGETKRKSIRQRLSRRSKGKSLTKKKKSKEERKRASLEKRKKKKESLSRKSTATIKTQGGNQEPVEAGFAFQSFFNQFTQGITDGIEYVTGIRLIADDDSQASSVYSSDYSDYSDEYDSDDFDEEFDERLQAVGEQERMKAASAWIEFEINRLVDIIYEIGADTPDEEGNPVTTFGDLMEVYSELSDTLVGILVRAKRSGRIYYERGAVGDMLFDGEDDDTPIVAF